MNLRYKRKYGISKRERDDMAIVQGHRCLICGDKPDLYSNKQGLVVDHEHGTGKIRGLLCNRCNLGLGHFYDDTNLLLKAIEYLNTTRK